MAKDICLKDICLKDKDKCAALEIKRQRKEEKVRLIVRNKKCYPRNCEHIRGLVNG